MKVETALERLKRIKDNIATYGVVLMQNEMPKRTGQMAASVQSSINGDTITIGTPKEYAPIVVTGRGEIRPRTAKALHWKGWPNGGDVFAMRSGPVKPNDFLIRTIKAIRETNWLDI